MTPTHLAQTGILDLISEAGLVAKLVLLLLLAASCACWAVIFSKFKLFRAATLQDKKFVDVFWKGKSVEEIITKTENFPSSPIATVFKSGIRELRKNSGSESIANTTPDKIDLLYRALARAASDELAALENHLSWLATTASAAPFIGLFGTVWGIMSSFQSIGATGNANLAVVAPGISEALITTAAGIGAAIPAVIAYNYFVNQARKVAAEMENFSQDLISIVQRSIPHRKTPS